jgi:uncharacterized membrane protein
MELAEPPATVPTVAGRVVSVDILRGVVMVIMALDHVRDFFTSVPFDPTDLTQTSVPLFLTRWITHFCAPTFVFLAGVGAGLSLAGGRSLSSLSRFLWTRGLWLVVAELTIVRFAWAFNFEYTTQLWVQVIWVLGWSMIVLAALVHLPRWAVATFGIVMIAGHNLLDGIPLHFQGGTLIGAGARDWIWSILHVQRMPIAYPLIPWLGVMAAGYAFAPILLKPRAERLRTLLLLGASLTLLFVLLRGLNVYGDPSPWAVQPRPGMTLMSFLNTTKYPPSLLYLLMTLGPAIMLLVPFERLRGPVAAYFDTIGRVPFFYYVLHIVLIHSLALIGGAITGFSVKGLLNPPFFGYGEGWGTGLVNVYLIWVFVVLALYVPCRWFAGVKMRRRDLWWLGYL